MRSAKRLESSLRKSQVFGSICRLRSARQLAPRSKSENSYNWMLLFNQIPGKQSISGTLCLPNVATPKKCPSKDRISLGHRVESLKIDEVSKPPISHHLSTLPPSCVRFEALPVSNMHHCFLRNKNRLEICPRDEGESSQLMKCLWHIVTIAYNSYCWVWPNFWCCPWDPRNSSILQEISHSKSQSCCDVL